MSYKARLTVVVAGLLVVAAVAAAVVTGIRFWGMNAEESARDEAASAARDYTVAMFSRDPKTVSENVNKTMDVLTGSAKEEFQKQMTQYRVADEVKKNKIVTLITIQGLGVMQNTRDTATVLVYMNLSTTRNASEEAQIDQSRIVYDMVRQGGKWMISTIDILDDESLRNRVSKVDGPPSGAVPIPGDPTSTPPAAPTSPAPQG